MSKPLTLRFLSVTPETPSAATPLPLKSLGLPCVAPITQAPWPSMVTFEALTMIGG